jgi:hypothetical protein
MVEWKKGLKLSGLFLLLILICTTFATASLSILLYLIKYESFTNLYVDRALAGLIVSSIGLIIILYYFRDKKLE